MPLSAVVEAQNRPAAKASRSFQALLSAIYPVSNVQSAIIPEKSHKVRGPPGELGRQFALTQQPTRGSGRSGSVGSSLHPVSSASQKSP